MVPEISIRLAHPDDFGALSAALASLPLYRPYAVTAARLTASWVEALARGDGLWVAARGEEPLGLSWWANGGGFGRGAYLRTLALKAGEEGHGTGRLLLEAFERETAAPSGWFLLVAKWNEGAQRFYQRHGYRQVGELPGFLVPEVTELIYWKRRPEAG